MSAVSAKQVKDLRDQTGAGMMDCKKALGESGGDFEKAVDILRKKGIAAAAKRKGREASEGSVASYIHTGGKVGVLLELNCETDFVARTDDFGALQRDICMHVAAMAPRYLKREDVPQTDLGREKDILLEQAKKEGKPENIVEKIVEGRMSKFFAESCLLEQTFVKNDEQTIQGLIDELSGKLGENITLRRFVRFELGESL